VIVVVHHTNAEGKKERGSKVLRNACDTIIRVALEDDLIAVQSQKTKDAKPFDTYYLSPVVKPLGYQNNIGEEVSSVILLPAAKVIRGSELTALQRRVLEYIEVEPSASVADIADAVECDSRGTISKVISALVKKGMIRVTASGREVTPEGNKAIKNDSTDSYDSTDSTGAGMHRSKKPMATPESMESLESSESDTPPLFESVERKRGRSYYQEGG
jgi:DNA-binding MarR family transcriptional regulator